MHLKHNSVKKLVVTLLWLHFFFSLSCLLRVAKYLSGNVNKKTNKPSVKAKMVVKKYSKFYFPEVAMC